tara:strand:- start:3635 stop:4225 length:591 start_codon:yes stop_codon:yes gene_type:complete
MNFIHIPKNGGTSIKHLCQKYNDLNITYNGHDAKVNELKNQIVILRNPYDRFISSVQYAYENYGESPQMKEIIRIGLTTPNDWVEAWSDINHIGHDAILNEIKNISHKIDSKHIPLKWTYCPQYYWVNDDNIKYVVSYDNLNEFVLDTFRKILPVMNESKPIKNCKLSNNSKKFLRNKYIKDFEMIDYFKAKYKLI